MSYSTSRARKPLIAISGRCGIQPGIYCAYFLVKFLGGIPKIVCYKNPPEKFDGLLLMGGTDVDPTLYKGRVKDNYKYDHERDELELALIKHAIKKEKPVVGICRGAQLLNVSLGGTLHYDVAQAYEEAKYPSSLLAKIFYRKSIYINKESLFYRLANYKTIRNVNSLHTQAVDELGRDLEITAQEKNGVVQVIENKEKRLLGVQFHPELLFYRRFSRRIFEWLIKESA